MNNNINPSRRCNMDVAIKNFGTHSAQVIAIDDTGKENWTCVICNGTISYDHDPDGRSNKLYCCKCGYVIWDREKIRKEYDL